MKRLFMLALASVILSSFTTKNPKTATVYPVVVKFLSTGAGVPSDEPLKRSILAFKKKNKLKLIQATKIAPLGKEGEYYLGFEMNEMTVRQKKDFITSIRAVVAEMDDRGKAEFEQNVAYSNMPTTSRTTTQIVAY